TAGATCWRVTMTDPQSRLDRLRDANEQLVVGAMRAQDLADHAEARLAERLRFGALESEIATVCATASAEHIDDRIRDCLRRVVTFLGVDRGALEIGRASGREAGWNAVVSDCG